MAVSKQYSLLARTAVERYSFSFNRFRSRKGSTRYAERSRPRKRTVRGGSAPLQADDRKNRPAYRAARPRVLREAHRRAQAQARRCRQAPLQAFAQPAASSEALLVVIAFTHDVTQYSPR